MIAPATELVSASLPLVPLTAVGGVPVLPPSCAAVSTSPSLNWNRLEKLMKVVGAVRRTCPCIGQRDAAVRHSAVTVYCANWPREHGGIGAVAAVENAGAVEAAEGVVQRIAGGGDAGLPV